MNADGRGEVTLSLFLIQIISRQLGRLPTDNLLEPSLMSPCTPTQPTGRRVQLRG